jgi:hypothetical protein
MFSLFSFLSSSSFRFSVDTPLLCRWFRFRFRCITPAAFAAISPPPPRCYAAAAAAAID